MAAATKPGQVVERTPGDRLRSTHVLDFLKTRVYGGSLKSASTAGHRLMMVGMGAIHTRTSGPLIAELTNAWKNLKIDIVIKVDRGPPPKLELSCQPTTSVMILRCSTAEIKFDESKFISAKLDKGGFEVVRRRKMKIREQVKYSGHISYENVLRVAKQLEVSGKSQAKEFAGTVKSVLATTATLGLRITGGKHPKFVLDKIDQGKWPVPDMASVQPLLDERGYPVDLVIPAGGPEDSVKPADEPHDLSAGVEGLDISSDSEDEAQHY